MYTMLLVRLTMIKPTRTGCRDPINLCSLAINQLGRYLCSANYDEQTLKKLTSQSDVTTQPEPTCASDNLVEYWCALNIADHSPNRNPNANILSHTHPRILTLKPSIPPVDNLSTPCYNTSIDVKRYDSTNLNFSDSAQPPTLLTTKIQSPSPVSNLASPVLTSDTELSLALKHYMHIATGLSKARLSGLVVSTALAGCALAASTSMAQPEFLAHCLRITACLGIGTGLTSAAANTINQIMEIPYDSQMIRTRNRVLVRGLITPGKASLFALGCASTGLSLLYFGVNPLVTALAAGNILLYTTIYTPLKRISQANTWIGALVGAIPPLMGWAAATGELQSGSLILASLLYVWQFPHFMALSWNLRHEYSKAGYVMTSILDPKLCKRVALRHAFGTSLVCLAGAGCSAISLGPWAGCALGLACLPANFGLIYYAWQFAKTKEDQTSSAAARRLFKATLFHLPVVMSAALIGTYFCAVYS